MKDSELRTRAKELALKIISVCDAIGSVIEVSCEILKTCMNMPCGLFGLQVLRERKRRGLVKKEIRLYNVLFPLWMLLLFPMLWVIVLPGNFIIDSLVLLVGMFRLKIQNKKEFYKRNILKIFGFGILSDAIGSAYLLFMMMGLQIGNMGDEWYMTVPALIIAAICIFLLNYFVTFRDNEKGVRMKLALLFAIVTAPYTFLVPSAWLYQF